MDALQFGLAAAGWPRQRNLPEHGRVFRAQGPKRAGWYRNDALREQFVSNCRDPGALRLTLELCKHKRLVRREPLAHVRVFFKDLAHLPGQARV